MPKELVRAVLARLGLRVFRTSTIPRGISLAVDLQRLFRHRRPTVVIDIGANIGEYSKFFATTFPDATIWAIEPITNTFRTLLKNVGTNARIRPENLAFGNQTGFAFMELMEDSSWCRVAPDESQPVHDTDRYQRVTMLRLDEFCDDRSIEHISILKSDCEGYDLKVLHGADRRFEKAAIDAVYVEVNFRRDGKHGDFFEIESYLTSFGYAFYGLYEYSGWQYDVSRVGYANALFISPRLAG